LEDSDFWREERESSTEDWGEARGKREEEPGRGGGGGVGREVGEEGGGGERTVGEDDVVLVKGEAESTGEGGEEDQAHEWFEPGGDVKRRRC
jgi:hypothetical protein